MKWRSRLWGWSSLPRVRMCGRVSRSGVGGTVVRTSDGPGGRRAGLAGLMTCGSPWACPYCSRRIAAERSTEVRTALEAVANAGGSAALITLTMRHHSGQSLKHLWDGLTKAWSSVVSGRRWMDEQQRYGVIGWVRTVEATHGESGWHIHIHAIVTFDGLLSWEMTNELAMAMHERWRRSLARRGLDSVADKGGLDVRMVSMAAESRERMSSYLSKITLEVVNQRAKNGRLGNRSPFGILKDALATGLAADCELWIEWEQGSKGHKQLTWSSGLREFARMNSEKSDDEIAAENERGEDAIVIEPKSWARMAHEAHDLLDAIELGGIERGIEWLRSRGLQFTVVAEGRGRPPRGPST